MPDPEGTPERRSYFATGGEIDASRIESRLNDLLSSYSNLLIATESWAVFAFVFLQFSRNKNLQDPRTRVWIGFGRRTFGGNLASRRVLDSCGEKMRLLRQFASRSNSAGSSVDSWFVPGALQTIERFVKSVPEPDKSIDLLGVVSIVSAVVASISLSLQVFGSYHLEPTEVSVLIATVGAALAASIISLVFFYALDGFWYSYLVARFGVSKNEALVKDALRPVAARLVKDVFSHGS